MDINILVGVVGIILSVLAYFAGVQRTERKYREDDLLARQNRIVEHMIHIPSGLGDCPVIELIRGGVLELKNDDELMAVLEKLKNRNYGFALPPQIIEELPAGSLLEFLGWFSKNRLKFSDIMNREKIKQVTDKFLNQR